MNFRVSDRGVAFAAIDSDTAETNDSSDMHFNALSLPL
jgi:hypothetical protein